MLSARVGTILAATTAAATSTSRPHHPPCGQHHRRRHHRRHYPSLCIHNLYINQLPIWKNRVLTTQANPMV